MRQFWGEGAVKELTTFLCFTLVTCHNWFCNCKYYSYWKTVTGKYWKKRPHICGITLLHHSKVKHDLLSCDNAETVSGILELKISSVNITLTSEQSGQKFRSLGLGLYPGLTAQHGFIPKEHYGPTSSEVRLQKLKCPL